MDSQLPLQQCHFQAGFDGALGPNPWDHGTLEQKGKGAILARTQVIFVEGDEDIGLLVQKLDLLAKDPADLRIVCDPQEGQSVGELARARHLPCHILTRLDWDGFAGSEVLPQTGRVAFIPAEAPPLRLDWEQIGRDGLVPLVGRQPFPKEYYTPHGRYARGWLADVALLHRPRGHRFAWDLMSIAANNWKYGYPVRWPCVAAGDADYGPAVSDPILTREARVLVVVPTFRHDDLLPRCLNALMDQTRTPDAIAVIDDASGKPPVDVVRAYPDVTLLEAERNVGPFGLLERIIDMTDFDAYLVQDDDDWGTNNKLARQLELAEWTGAEMVCGQQLEVFHPDHLNPQQRAVAEHGALLQVNYPLDLNKTMKTPEYGMPHSGTLYGRALWERIGGFETMHRLTCDTDFLWRARFAGSHFRRKGRAMRGSFMPALKKRS